MILSNSQIIALASDLQPEVTALQTKIETAVKAAWAHNGAKGAPPIEAGNLVTVRGALDTIAEQLASHVQRNTTVVEIKK